MHLTNYAINKIAPVFIQNKTEYEDHIGHKRSYSATMKVPLLISSVDSKRKRMRCLKLTDRNRSDYRQNYHLSFYKNDGLL